MTPGIVNDMKSASKFCLDCAVPQIIKVGRERRTIRKTHFAINGEMNNTKSSDSFFTFIEQGLYVVLFILLLFTDAVNAQDKQKITYKGTEYEISALQKNSGTFLSVSDFASRLHFQTFKNTDKNKIELRFSQKSLIVTANNPFVVVRSKQDGTIHTMQITPQAAFSNGDIYISLEAFAKILDKQLDISFSWDNAAGTPKETEKVSTETERTESEEVQSATSATFSYTVNEKANGTLVSFKAKQKLKKYTADYKTGTITVQFAKTKLVGTPKSFSSRKGLVRSIEWTQEKDNTVVTVMVSGDYSSYELILDDPNTLLLTVHNQKFSQKSKPVDPAKQKWKFDVIVLDAGHGGKDYGAIGVHNTVEKVINLGVALKLGKLIQQNMKEVKVVYTRKDDTFIELYKRGKIANEANGKLFISIHCNSVQAKVSAPNGYEIYLLRPGRTTEAINIAERENSVINYEDNPSRYGKLTDENFILVSMAHSSYMRYSEKFAEILNSHLSSGTDIASRGIKQAGFYVLVGAAMPSILFETGYVTNENDSNYMKSESGQQEIANSIFQAIKSFKAYYGKEIESD